MTFFAPFLRKFLLVFFDDILISGKDSAGREEHKMGAACWSGMRFVSSSDRARDEETKELGLAGLAPRRRQIVQRKRGGRDASCSGWRGGGVSVLEQSRTRGRGLEGGGRERPRDAGESPDGRRRSSRLLEH